VRLLFIGDAFASAGRRIIESRVPGLRDELELDFVVANGENLADGVGITSRVARRLLAAGVDAITLGNHALRQSEVYPFLDSEPRIVRPANLSDRAPGRGLTVCTGANGSKLAVVNLMGSLFLEPARSPFSIAQQLVAEAREQTPLVLVDFHAEATSEKVAMGRYLDGSATAVVGTHTHVQTSDAHILPGGTAYITDAGMTGPRGGVIGVKREQAIESLLTQMPVRFETSEVDPWLMGVLIRCSQPLRADSIEQVLMPKPPAGSGDR
jgi:2',3'-cyclic-nucleotide 2'-phosphodiesterase